MKLDNLTVKQLIKICQKYKIKKYSGLKKKQLIRHINRFLNQNNTNEKNVVIYTKSTCPFCINAKLLLKKEKIKYIEKEVVKNQKYLEEMKKRTHGKNTVPQIFINGKYIGGFSELQTYLENKK